MASSSPRRRSLLEDARLSFSVCTPLLLEPLPFCGEDSSSFAIRSATQKAKETSAHFPTSIVLGFDTIISFQGNIFGKPLNHEKAFEYLSLFRGNKHHVITGCAICYSGKTYSFSCKTEVEFWNCPIDIIQTYAFDEEVLDKAGAYAIQGKGSFLVKAIYGSWSNVVGLPVAELMNFLLQKNFLRSSIDG